MTYPWIKLYTEALHDPKMARCTPVEKWCWIGLLLLAGESGQEGAVEITAGEPYTITELAKRLDVEYKALQDALAKFHKLHMISTAPGGAIHITNWDKRQARLKPSDAPERVRERVNDYRARRAIPTAGAPAGRKAVTPHVTPPVTDVTPLEEDKKGDQTRARVPAQTDVWDRVLADISLQMTAATFGTWFRPCRGEPDEATHTLKILAPSPNHAVWIAKRLNNKVNQSVANVLGKDWKWEITN